MSSPRETEGVAPPIAAYTLVGLLAFPQTAVELKTAYLSLEGARRSWQPPGRPPGLKSICREIKEQRLKRRSKAQRRVGRGPRP